MCIATKIELTFELRKMLTSFKIRRVAYVFQSGLLGQNIGHKANLSI